MSQNQPFLYEVLEDKPIPIGKLAYFRERFRDHLYELVVDEFLRREADGLTRAELARRIHRKPEQITRWLGSPGNWTLETVSDLILAICKAEPDVSLKPLRDDILRNHTGQSVLDAQQSKEPPEPRKARSAVDAGGMSAQSATAASWNHHPRNTTAKAGASL